MILTNRSYEKIIRIWDGAFTKRYVNAYVHLGNKCLLAGDIKGVMHYQDGPINTSVLVFEIAKPASIMPENKIVKIQSYGSVLFSEF